MSVAVLKLLRALPPHTTTDLRIEFVYEQDEVHSPTRSSYHRSVQKLRVSTRELEGIPSSRINTDWHISVHGTSFESGNALISFLPILFCLRHYGYYFYLSSSASCMFLFVLFLFFYDSRPSTSLPLFHILYLERRWSWQKCKMNPVLRLVTCFLSHNAFVLTSRLHSSK